MKVCTRIQVDPVVKMYSYHYLYTWSDFLADLGGYLGLFLGLSVFSVVEILERTTKRRRRRRRREKLRMEAVQGLVETKEKEENPSIVRRKTAPTRQFCTNVFLQ